MVHNKIKAGLHDGIPIAAGYFSVSFTFGMMAVQDGISPFHAVLISLLNLTSAGQFAGLTVIVTGASLFEMALTQLVINIRYALMSVSLSQKLDKSVKSFQRMLIAYGNTDEIFAVASSKPGTVGAKYMLGLIMLPVAGWVGGTACGYIAGSFLPDVIQKSAVITIYAMFASLLGGEASKLAKVLLIALISAVMNSFLILAAGVATGVSFLISLLVSTVAGAFIYTDKEAGLE